MRLIGETIFSSNVKEGYPRSEEIALRRRNALSQSPSMRRFPHLLSESLEKTGLGDFQGRGNVRHCEFA
nr:hypothetical protein [Paraburkholderia phenoliruptrix]